MARPQFKPTAPQRDKVKLWKAIGWSNERIAAQLKISRNTLEAKFASEIEFGADAKEAEVMANLQKASKKGSPSASKMLLERISAARAAAQMEHLSRTSAEAPTEATPQQPRLGKKELQNKAAEGVSGVFAPPAGPSKAVH